MAKKTDSKKEPLFHVVKRADGVCDRTQMTAAVGDGYSSEPEYAFYIVDLNANLDFLLDGGHSHHVDLN